MSLVLLGCVLQRRYLKSVMWLGRAGQRVSSKPPLLKQLLLISWHIASVNAPQHNSKRSQHARQHLCTMSSTAELNTCTLLLCCGSDWSAPQEPDNMKNITFHFDHIFTALHLCEGNLGSTEVSVDWSWLKSHLKRSSIYFELCFTNVLLLVDTC